MAGVLNSEKRGGVHLITQKSLNDFLEFQDATEVYDIQPSSKPKPKKKDEVNWMDISEM